MQILLKDVLQSKYKMTTNECRLGRTCGAQPALEAKKFSHRSGTLQTADVGQMVTHP